MDIKTGNNSNQGNRNYNYETQKDTAEEKTFGNSDTTFSFSFDASVDVDQLYRTPRSQAYLDIIASIDLLSATDEEIIEKLKEVVDEDTLEEFSEMTPEEIIEELRLCFEEEMHEREMQLKDFPEPEVFIGVISKCYISGCDIHAIDKKGNILEHFQKSAKLPEGYDRARMLYHKMNGACHCIEIYNNCCRVIASDGSVTKVNNE